MSFPYYIRLTSQDSGKNTASVIVKTAVYIDVNAGDIQ